RSSSARTCRDSRMSPVNSSRTSFPGFCAPLATEQKTQKEPSIGIVRGTWKRAAGKEPSYPIWVGLCGKFLPPFSIVQQAVGNELIIGVDTPLRDFATPKVRHDLIPFHWMAHTRL